MTITEAQLAVAELNAEIGGYSSCVVVLSAFAGPLCWSIYPVARDASKTISGHASTWRETIADMRAAWLNWKDQNAATKIRAMALRIITITAEHGGCTESALRLSGDFTEADITAHGADACQEANRLAGNGPFTITTTPSNQNEAA